MKHENFVVIIFVTILVVVDCIFCALVRYNKITPKIFDKNEFELSDSNDLAEITSISQQDSYIYINGVLNKKIETYEVYVAIKDKDNKIKGFKTEWDNTDNANKFFCKIKKKYLESDTSLYIIYKCDNKNILIKTNNIVGDKI